MSDTVQPLQRRIGSERFRIEGQLGRGGMGVVYRAFDQERGAAVALKTVKDLDAAALYRFKQEFRALSDLSHPNLVALYELIESKGLWFFTMELVEGVDFLSYVRGVDAKPASSAEALETLATETRTADVISLPSGSATSVSSASGVRSASSGRSLAPHAKMERLRPALAQLGKAIVALHDSGHLHRDIKPSNVLVTAEGRVVVLDFGVITELAGRRSRHRKEEVVGTRGYMAPELFEPGYQAVASSDWYAFGVVLYQALAGRRPFVGSATEVLSAQALHEPPPIELFWNDVPADLSELCMSLLARDPTMRPTGTEVLRLLGRQSMAPAPVDIDDDALVVGRDAELDLIRSAYHDVLGSEGRAVFVGGRSGFGKSVLCQSFLDELTRDRGDRTARDVVVLMGRCYERESVPYKALDSLVDALYRHLSGLPAEDVARLLPPDTGALARAFPVLMQLEAVAHDHPHEIHLGDGAAELRRRAFGALRELLSRLAQSKPLVLFIDDLQWGDVDSAPFLVDLILHARLPLLLIASYRSEERETSPLLRTLLGSIEEQRHAGALEIVLGDIPVDQLEKLAATLLEQRGAPTTAARRIAEEAGGSPYFAQELARAAVGHRGADAGTMSLDALILARVQELAEPARRLLEVIAVAGGKISQDTVERAAGLAGEDLRASLELRAERLVRTSGVRGVDIVEPYHDRVREAVVASLSPERQRETHLGIAHALDTADAAAGERLYALARHYFHGDPDDRQERVIELNLAAAEMAGDAYAYDQAFAFYEQARSYAEAHGRPLEDAAFARRFAEACARTGRVALADQYFRKALDETADPFARSDIFFGLSKISLGQLDAATAHLHVDQALRALGHRRPRLTPLDIVKTLSMFLRGRGVTRRGEIGSASEGDREMLVRLAQLYGHASKTAYFEMDRFGYIQATLRMLLPAARVGVSSMLANYYTIASVANAALGRQALSQSMAARGDELAEVLRDPVIVAQLEEYRGHGEHLLGRPLESERFLRHCLETRGHLLENMDYFTAVADLCWNLLMRGHSADVAGLIANAQQRASLQGEQAGIAQGHTYRCYVGPALAAIGRVEEGRRQLAEYAEIIADEDDRWRWGQYLASRILFHVEAGELDDELERLVEQHRRMRLSPKAVPPQMRHVYVALAYARLWQLDRAPEAASSATMRNLDRALRALERAAQRGEGTVAALWRRRKRPHPTLLAHLLVVRGALRLRCGQVEPGRTDLAEAAALAEAHDNPWVRFEVDLELARFAFERGDEAEGRASAARARATADEHGWPLRAERVSALGGTAAGR